MRLFILVIILSAFTINAEIPHFHKTRAQWLKEGIGLTVLHTGVLLAAGAMVNSKEGTNWQAKHTIGTIAAVGISLSGILTINF